ncbi:13369_t:CDS:1, partial [Gigaspora margarita]
ANKKIKSIRTVKSSENDMQGISEVGAKIRLEKNELPIQK